jgi:hypothetical protein
MWGAIIGAVTSIGGGIASAIGANKARKIQEEELKKREERQAATYARRINQDYTQRADAQRMLKITRDALKQRAEAAAGRQAVMGLTDSGLAAEREMAENVMADTASQIAAAGEAQKDEAEKIYEQQQDANSQQRANIAANRAVATGQAVGQMVEGVGKAAGALTGEFGKQPTGTKSFVDVGKATKEADKAIKNAPDIAVPEPWEKPEIGKNVPGYHLV